MLYRRRRFAATARFDRFQETGSIATEFTEAERHRFRSLLELARGSQYEGESKNALEAAKRLAAKHGMSLEEAARAAPGEQETIVDPHTYRAKRPTRAPDVFYGYESVNVEAIHEAKRRRDEAVQRARDRGLDEAERKSKRRQNEYRKSTSKARRNPHSHASVLLKETSLPFSEIASITGLDLYVVVGLKLKLRQLV